MILHLREVTLHLREVTLQLRHLTLHVRETILHLRQVTLQLREITLHLLENGAASIGIRLVRMGYEIKQVPGTLDFNRLHRASFAEKDSRLSSAEIHS